MAIGPDGVYLAPQFDGFPIPDVRNDVQGATIWNMVIAALNALSRFQVVLSWAEGAELTAAFKGAPISMSFGGRVIRAALELDVSGDAVIHVLKNGVIAYTITIVAGVEIVTTGSVSSPLFTFDAEDTLQAEVVSASDATAFSVSLEAIRT